jgi:hypothetical protein
MMAVNVGGQSIISIPSVYPASHLRYLLPMKRFLPLAILLPLATAAASTPPASRADLWWADIAAIADDANEGREPGTPGYERAAVYVEKRFRALGLAPAGDGRTFRQNVALTEQRVDYPASTAELVGTDGAKAPVALGVEMLVTPGSGPRPAAVDAPLVFIGYGLHLPEQGHDDFAGVDLKGKIAVVIAGGPANIPGPVKASNRSERAKLLGQAGALGVITLTPPKQIEIPWARQKLLSPAPGMYLADAALREVKDGFLIRQLRSRRERAPVRGQRPQLRRSRRGFGRIATHSLASRSPSGSRRTSSRTTVRSPRPISLPGWMVATRRSNANMSSISAHLDHVGVGAPINGDAIYNGAMDDASGVASVLDIAASLKAGPRPKRSILFVIVTAEEKGLLGSSYFAMRPTVPHGTIAANLNFDMPLPLWPLTTMLVQGDRESTLGDPARAVAASRGLSLIADPLPNRNSFIRTDQYSFVREGIPSLAFKFGFPAWQRGIQDRT